MVHEGRRRKCARALIGWSPCSQSWLLFVRACATVHAQCACMAAMQPLHSRWRSNSLCLFRPTLPRKPPRTTSTPRHMLPTAFAAAQLDDLAACARLWRLGSRCA